MKSLIFVILISSLFFTSCSWVIHDDESMRVVSIYWSKNSAKPIFLWMWVMRDSYLLTSAHVVSDERVSYSLYEWDSLVQLYHREKDTLSDRIVMSVGNASLQTPVVIADLLKDSSRLQNGDDIYTIVSRSGSLLRIDGKILEVHGKTLGYTPSGQTYSLSWIILTDLRVIAGDSGAPIFTTAWGMLIDVVHVAGK